MQSPPLVGARRTLVRFLVRSFLNGLLVLAPVAATAWILWKLFQAVDGLLPLPDTVAPGVGFALVVALVIAVGILASSFLAAQALALSERLLARVPFVKLVYSSIKDLTEAFVGKKKKFDRPVLVSLGPGLEAEVIGFVTREELSELGLSERVRPIARPAGEVMAFVVSGGLAAATSE